MNYGKPEKHLSRKSADETDPAARIELQQLKQRGAKGALGTRALGNMAQQPQQQPQQPLTHAAASILSPALANISLFFDLDH